MLSPAQMTSETSVLRVPTLKALFQRLPNQRYLIELKPEATSSADALCELIVSHGLQDQGWVWITIRIRQSDFGSGRVWRTWLALHLGRLPQ